MASDVEQQAGEHDARAEPLHHRLDDVVSAAEIERLAPQVFRALAAAGTEPDALAKLVDRRNVDYRFFERPYFVAPADTLAGEGYVVIRDALRKMRQRGWEEGFLGGDPKWIVAGAFAGAVIGTSTPLGPLTISWPPSIYARTRERAAR